MALVEIDNEFEHYLKDSYNRYTLEINRATYLPERETLLDRRHAYFVDKTYFNQNYAEAG